MAQDILICLFPKHLKLQSKNWVYKNSKVISFFIINKKTLTRNLVWHARAEDHLAHLQNKTIKRGYDKMDMQETLGKRWRRSDWKRWTEERSKKSWHKPLAIFCQCIGIVWLVFTFLLQYYIELILLTSSKYSVIRQIIQTKIITQSHNSSYRILTLQ